jgi:protein-S-isoprenylcysteine O-methyltransferase Ste14
MSTKSFILICLQFACFAYFIFNENLLVNNTLITIQIIGFILSIWAIFVMRIGNFNVQPEVKINAVFITKGPYMLIRNPMYTGLLLFFSANIIANFSFFSLAIFTILFVVFLTKINMEEGFLSQKFGMQYEIYKKRTYRLLPFIY